MTLSVTKSLILGINNTKHNADVVMLIVNLLVHFVVMLSVVMVIVIMLSGIKLSFIVLSVMAPYTHQVTML